IIIRSTALKWIGILQMSVVRAHGRIVMTPRETALTPAQLPLWNLLIERHEFQGSRLFSPRAFSIGVAAWRVLSGRGRTAVCHAGSKCLILAGLGTQNSSKNVLHRRAVRL